MFECFEACSGTTEREREGTEKSDKTVIATKTNRKEEGRNQR